jgi:hypothetical protein
MAAIKLQKFLGIAPKVSPELLPDGVGQTAHNLKLYSGDLIAIRDPLLFDSAERTGVIKTIFGMRDSNNNPDWLSWTADVDIIIASDSSDDEQRIYYTGDGSAKITTYALASTGAEPYPLAYYDLGLPLPTAVLSSAAASFSSASTTHYERDAGNTAIITTSAAHGFRTGAVVTVRAFTGSPAEEFNVVNTQITVTSPTKFEYYNAGATQAEAADTNGRVDLAGGTVTRDYTYTWYTPWDEESIGAVPSDTLFIKEGQIVTLTAIPTAAPSGDNFIEAVRLYRTFTGASGTEFYRLSTLWFPQTTTTVELTSNVATVTLSEHHNFIVGDKFKLIGCTDSVFDIHDGVVTVVDSDTQFSYAQTNADISSKADTTGKLTHDASELPGTDPARYWGALHATSLRERTSNVTTMTTAENHGFVTGQIATISGMTDTSFNETDAVLTVTGDTTFTYPDTGGNEVSASDTGGSVQSYSFADDFDYLNLVDLLITDDYDAPHADMVGIKVAQNDMVVGFWDNQLAFAEPGTVHAWPLEYRRTFEHTIVAIEAVGGYLLVMTEQYAYRVSGSDPRTLTIARIDTLYPCLSKRSVVNMGYGVLYATHGGLALWTPSTGLTLATKYVYDWDIWDVAIDASTIVAKFYNDKYFASHSTGSFMFERDDQIGGYFITMSELYTAAWLDPLDDTFYYIADETGGIYKWDDVAQPAGSGQWKSKVIVTKDYINLGAARVIADYTTTTEEAVAIAAHNTAVPINNAATWVLSEQLGGINGPTDYMDGVVAVNNKGGINSFELNGDGLTENLRGVVGTQPVVFTLWQDKTQVFSATILSDEIFRLPSGYKSDTFEVSVSGGARVRAIHLGETPDGLRKA